MTTQPTTHTPGPWKIAGGTGKAGQLYIWMGGEYFGGHAIATVHDRVPEQAIDNARLIAAAPELLAALEELTSQAQYMHNCIQAGSTMQPMDWGFLAKEIATARAAIQKAKGQ